MPDKPYHERGQLVAAEANRMYLHGDDWLTIFRSILGSGGLARKQFPNPDAWAAWEDSAAKLAVDLLIHVRKQEVAKGWVPAFAGISESRTNVDRKNEKADRHIMLRTTTTLYNLLREEGFARKISLNRLCNEKLAASCGLATESRPPAPVVHPVHHQYASTSRR